MISWLHVSDIHLNKLGTETKRMRSQLIPFLKNEGIKCKYLFVTGDLRYAPNGAFDLGTVDYLRELQEAVCVSDKNVFIVPGNHDVNRETLGRDVAIQQNLIADKFDSRNGEIDGEVLKVLKSSQQDYISVLEDLYKDVSERIKEYKQILNPHFLITTDDFNIVHIDSTLSYTEKHERDLVIGTSMLMDVFDRLDKGKPTILLSHYSFDFLSRSEQKEIHKLMMDYNVRMWLAGHEHN